MNISYDFYYACAFKLSDHACAIDIQGGALSSYIIALFGRGGDSEMDALRESPELRPFVLSNVRPTGTTIGAGSYGSVEEVAIPGAICAAKKIHELFLDRSELPR